jgi:hypothetical protein
MKASARIQVTLDVQVANTWPGGTDIATIHQEAITAGLERLAEIFKYPASPRIVGEPRVTIVLVEDV